MPAPQMWTRTGSFFTESLGTKVFQLYTLVELGLGRKPTGDQPVERSPHQLKKPASGAKARIREVVYTYSNRLTTASYLSFSDDCINQIESGLVDPKKEFDLMLRRVRKKLPDEQKRFPYMLVPEFSEKHRLHFHLMLPGDFNFEPVKEQWERNGLAQSKKIESDIGLVKMGFYLAKNFDKPVFERPYDRRFFTAPGFKPKKIDHGLMTATEAEELAQQKASQVGQVIKEFLSNKPWLRGGFTWFDESDFQEGDMPPWAA